MGIPEKIDKYRVLAIAGRGSMGTVYTAYDSFAERDVAIKVCESIGVDERIGSDELNRELFLNEGHITSSLDHPNILRVLDAGEHEGEAYIVMEHVGGGNTLKRYCDARSLLPIERVAKIVFKCARALDYTHRRGVIHCDIKPSNIMLTPEGEVKIGDFGIAKRLAEITRAVNIMGSPRYMSPEQIREEEVCGQTDLYSLGTVLFELLTGRPPFSEARVLSQLINLVLHGKLPAVRDLRPDIPAGLEFIVDRALAKEREGRYQSGAEMASDLAALFPSFENEHASPEVRALPQQQGVELGKPFERHELMGIGRPAFR